MAQVGQVDDSSAAIVRVFFDDDAARAAIRALKEAGVAPESISVLTRSPAEADRLEETEAASDDLEHVAVRHNVLGEFLDWLGRVESVAVPGFGAVLNSGNLWQDLSVREEHGRGAIVGALVGVGVPVDQAAVLEQQVFAGRIVVVVHGAADSTAVSRILG